MSTKHGKHKDKICYECINKPLIKGNGWIWHC